MRKKILICLIVLILLIISFATFWLLGSLGSFGLCPPGQLYASYSENEYLGISSTNKSAITNQASEKKFRCQKYGYDVSH